MDIGDSSLTADAAELKRQVYVQLLTPANTVALPAFDRRTPRCYAAVLLRRPAAAVIDRDLLPDEPTSANLSSGVRWAKGTDRRQTNRRTPDSCIDPAPNTMRVAPTIQILVILRHMVLLNKCYRNPLMHDLIYFAL